MKPIHRPKYSMLLLRCLCLLLLAGCGQDDDYESPHKPVAGSKPHVTEQYHYAVYIENSISLNGYLNAEGDSSFKNNILALISELNSFSDKRSISLFDINSKAIPVAIDADAAQVSGYIRDFNAGAFRRRSDAHKGNQAQSDLQTVFKTVTDSMKSDDVRIVVSDGIFSPGKNADAKSYLGEQRRNIQVIMAERLRRQPFATLVLQFFSDFNGRYYYEDNSYKEKYFKQRPYYIFCFGNERALSALLAHIQNQSDLKGQYHYLFLAPESQYNVKPLLRPFNNYYDYDPEMPLTVSGMEKDEQDGKYRVKFGVDLSQIPASAAYLEDKSNYSITSGFSIKSVASSDKKGFSHEFVLVAAALQTGKLSFSLKKQLPQWVGSTSLESDLGASPKELEGKTFGIRYLLEGLFSAYRDYTYTSDYFNFSITIKE